MRNPTQVITEAVKIFMAGNLYSASITTSVFHVAHHCVLASCSVKSVYIHHPVAVIFTREKADFVRNPKIPPALYKTPCFGVAW